jgi:hypothetical protein
LKSTDTSRESVFDHPSALNLTPRQATVVLPSLLVFLGLHATKIGNILLGEDGKWSNKDLRDLERVVTQEAASSERAADYLRVLRKACAFWAGRERLDVGYPRIPTVLVHPLNPFRGNFAKLLRNYDSWKRVLDQWLNTLKSLEPESDEASAGLAIDALVLSSIIFGGLHTRSSVVGMLRALADAQNRTLCVDGKMHIELSLSWRGIPDVEFRRWQPDALTATLWTSMPDGAIRVLLDPEIELLQLSAMSDVQLGKKIKERIDARLKQMPRLEEPPRGGLDRLMQAANLAAYTEIPAILAAYAGRKLISHSLKRRAFERLSSRKPCTTDTPLSAPERITDINIVDFGVLRTPPDLEPEWLKAVRTTLSADAEHDVRQAMNQLARETVEPCFVGRLADFLDWLLSVRTPSGKPRTLSSAKRTVIELARSMGPILEVPDPMDLDTASREELYSRIIEGAGSLPSDIGIGTSTKMPRVSKRRRNLSRALYEFERFLNSKGKERVEDESIFCGRYGLSLVDANLLTFEDYTNAINEVDKVWPPREAPERNRIGKILLCLGFRIGLRRLEALHCLTADIGPGPDFEFIVRPTEFRRLKTRSARRRIPLTRFLSSEEELNELRLILEWQQQRRDEQESSVFLLGISDKLDVVPQSLIEDLNEILRKVTGDPQMHFHQLRHSFASWNWLRLMLADVSGLPDLFPHLKATSKWLREGPEFRTKMYGHAGVTRKHAYFIAQQLGHLSPSTSMQTYIHFADYLLGLFLSLSIRMSPSKEQILEASRMPRQTAARWGLDETNLLALPIALWRNRGCREELLRGTTERSYGVEVEWAKSVYEFLRELESGGSVDKAATLHHFDVTIANKIYSGMKDLGYAQSTGGHWIRRKGRNGSKKERLNWPSNPGDQAVIRHVGATLAKRAQSSPEAVVEGIRCYLQRVWETKSIIVFQDVSEGEQAFAFVQFLGELGIMRGDIDWFTFVKGRERSSDRAEWKKKVRYNRHDNDIQNLPRQGGEKWFGIKPRLEKWAGDQRSMNPGAYGFRFLMRMAYLRWR